jgi:hypothetical protein
MTQLTANQHLMAKKIRTLKTVHNSIKAASILQKASMAENAIGLAIEVLEHLALEVINKGEGVTQ